MRPAVEATVVSSVARLPRKSAHRRCGRCGKIVSRRAIFCKRCGKQQRMNPRSLLLACAGVFLMGVFAVATAGAKLPFGRLMGMGRHAAAAPAPAPQPEPAAAGLLTATELWDLYSLNAAKADALYKNKTVEITGRVAEVRRDFHNNFLLRLSTEQPFETVRATVLNRADDRSHTVPVPGQTVALRCTGRGALIGSPILDACVAI
jgi:hypothetical protein